MQRGDVVELVKFISGIYGNKFKLADKTEAERLITAWHMVFEDCEFDSIMSNLRLYVKTNKFPPAPSDLLQEDKPKDRAIPTYDETMQMFQRWDEEKKNIASEEVANGALATMREILGIVRG